MEPFHCTCVDTVNSIKKEDWDAFFGGCPEGRWFYETLEESELSEFTFHYLLVRKGDRLASIIPLFTADFQGDTILEEPLRKTIRAVRSAMPRFFVFKTLFCGSPFGEQGLLGIDPAHRDDPALTDAILRGLADFSRLKKLSLTIFKDYAGEDAAFLEGLTRRGFFKAESFPNAVIDLPFHTFEDYLASLSHASRKDLRRKMKKAREQGMLEIEIAGSVRDRIQDVYRLYLNTYEAGGTKFEKLTPGFFLKASEKGGPSCKYFLYYIKGKLAAFNLCFLEGGLLIDKFIGFDYDVSRQYGLYFVSWCENIRWCIDNGISRYQVGQTDYEAKKHLGCRLVPLHAFARHTSAPVNWVLPVLAKYLDF